MNGISKFYPAISLVVFLFLTTSGNAQHLGCGFDELLQQQLTENPQLWQVYEGIERHTQEFLSHQSANDRTETTITIPVVIHVVYFNSAQNLADAQILSQIDVLNADFRRTNADASNTPAPFQSVAADCQINFCMASRDPNGNPTNGIERRQTTVEGFFEDVKENSMGGLDSWDSDRYLNIWVCDIDDQLGFAGYAYLPGTPDVIDGVVVDYLYFGTINATPPLDKGRTTTHEVGHWLNLYHSFGDAPSNVSSCTDTDMVDDTPNQDDATNFDCPSFPTISCNNGPNGDMFMNYMDYAADNCKNLFTIGQKNRMQALFAPGGFRASFNCENPCGQNPYINTFINSNTTYNTNMSMAGDIYVHSGAELVIEATIGMRPGTRILIERNARLIVRNGGKITRLCADWAGIQVLGNNQKIQPEHDAPLTDPDQAGIVRIEGGTVEWARNGVTAGGGYGPEFWGGVVRTSNNAIFQNNRKDVEFMSYKFSQNKSRFLNTTFIEFGNAFANTEGVTIWETDGIEFNNCIFKNKDREGIFTYDAGVTVLNNNQFDDNNTGINSYATYPMSSGIQIGSGSETENKFTNNEYHIIASNIVGTSFPNYSLGVINNNFTGGIIGITVDGASNFRIAGNLVSGFSTAGVVTYNTGYNNLLNQNLIGCNTFKQSSSFGIFAIGENRELQFLGNDFQLGSTSADFVLAKAGSPAQNGRIRATQGENVKPAANCFSDPGTLVDIGTLTSTTTFKYYYLADEPPVDCDPEPLTLGSYTKQFVVNPSSVIDCDQFGGLPPGLTDPTSGDLNTRRATLQQLAPYIATDENALNQYYKTLQEKDAILRYLLEQSQASGQYATMEGLLAGEQSKAADWAIFGLRMDRKDYTNAALWLYQLPIQNEEDTKFRDVQTINLQRLQNLGAFQLSAEQETYLNSVAESTSPVRGYARGILGLLKDRRFYPDEIEFGNGKPEVPIIKRSESTQNTLLVSPVPAMSTLSVSWPLLPTDSDTRLLIYDIFGKHQVTAPISSAQSQCTLEVGHLPIGVYFLVISDRGKPLHQTKFSIQR